MEKNNTSNKNWKGALDAIYNLAPDSWIEGEKFAISSDDQPLAKKLGIKGNELSRIITFLKQQGLIETKKHTPQSPNAFWQITEKGFNVALENEKRFSEERGSREQFGLNRTIKDATVVLAIAAFLDFLFYILSKDFTLNITKVWQIPSVIFLLSFAIILVSIMVKLIIEILWIRRN